MDKKPLDNVDMPDFLNNVSESGDGNSDNLTKSRHELNEIQNDLNSLIDCINSFVTDNPDYSDTEMDDVANITKMEEDMDIYEEDTIEIDEDEDDCFANNIYGLDDNDVLALNWQAMAPLFHNIVADLDRLQALHHQTNSVVDRIRKLAEEADKMDQNSNEKQDEDAL